MSIMRSIAIAVCFIFGAVFVAAQSGCSEAGAKVDPAVLAQHKDRFKLTSEPDGVQTVLDVRETILGKAHEDCDHEDCDHHDHDHGHHEDDHEHEDADHDHAHHEHEHEHSDHDHLHYPTEAMDVAMVGKVGGLTNPWEETQREFPFVKNQAILFLSDPQAIAENEEAGHVHAPGEECAFCAAHAEENSSMIAMVRFVDEEGKVVPIDSRQLFDVKLLDTVVISGKARVVEGGMLVVDAIGLYIRR